MEKYEWVSFYGEFARKLLEYKDNRDELIKIVKSVYDNTGLKMPSLEQDDNIVDIDPFTVIGLFNKSSMKEINRKTIMKEFATLLKMEAKVPSSFDSIPVLNRQNATYYQFINDRDSDDINNLWSLFIHALGYASSGDEEEQKVVCKYFDLCISTKGNAKAKITMGLYWIAPDTYINLDSRNMWYIYECGKLPKELVDSLPTIKGNHIDSQTYFHILEKLKDYLTTSNSELKDFVSLSTTAWIESMKNPSAKGRRKKKTLDDDDLPTRSTQYWIYSAGAHSEQWDTLYSQGIMAIYWNGLGDLSMYESRDEIMHALQEENHDNASHNNDVIANWQFANEMRVGDIVIVKKGMNKIIGRGIVESDYIYHEYEPEFKHIREVKWTNKGEWVPPHKSVTKTLTNITRYTEYVQKLEALFGIEGKTDSNDDLVPYTKEDFLNKVYMSNEQYDELRFLLANKLNVILQGAPGVGKTFIAERLAYSIMGVKDSERVQTIQFHQSYSYEDFIQGYRPTSDNGFELKDGQFYRFCDDARENPDKSYFFIIDEINRGNISKIFGELLMLIEKDKRNKELPLLYEDEKFSVPSNVYIIGTMNTADRSLALMDYALRRRFAFYEIKPAFDSEGFKTNFEIAKNKNYDNVITVIKELNKAICDDESLGTGFQIGHSYFCVNRAQSNSDIRAILKYEILPLIKEYWFDDQAKIDEWTAKLLGAIND